MFEIIGTGSCLPQCSKSNDDLAEFLDTSDEWISKRTGIKRRSVCVEESHTDLIFYAAERALENAGVQAGELDLILCATVRGDYISPSSACVIQQRLGASCPAMDINAACTGFIYCLDVAAGYFARGRVKKVLVVAGEAMSRLVNWRDRSTCVLFGDGAGAAVLGEGNSLLSIKLTAHGNPEALYIPHVSGNSPFIAGENQETYLKMEGQEVYKFAVSAMCTDVKDVTEQAGITQQQIDWLIPHQANQRIIATASHKLEVPDEKYLMGIENMGNISAASIPVLIDRANRAGKFHEGDILALTAFGAGLTTGACILKWAKPPKLPE